MYLLSGINILFYFILLLNDDDRRGKGENWFYSGKSKYSAMWTGKFLSRLYRKDDKKLERYWIC